MSAAKERPRVAEMGAGTLAAFTFAYLAAIALLVVLIHNAGIWNVLANTRALAPLIDGGFVALTDADNGLLVPNGPPSAEYYVASQDPVDWMLVLGAAALFLVIWGLRAVQFHGLARFAGLSGGFRRHARAYLYGQGLGRLLPYRTGDVGVAAALEGQGVELERAAQVISLTRGFVIFEIAAFAFVGLLYQGFTAWLGELFWPLLMLLAAYFLTRRGHSRTARRAARREWIDSARLMLRGLAGSPRLLVRLALLSIATFFTLELATYVVAQAFTSTNVVLNVEFDVILMGLVGGYIATLIPITPGGLGQWEWGMASALYAGGLGFPECVTLALLLTTVRYVTGGALFAAIVLGPGVETSPGRVLTLYGGTDGTARAAAPVAQLPSVRLPSLTPPPQLLARALILVAILFAAYLLDQLADVLLDLWLLESLGFEDVFWTNFSTAAVIFVVCSVAFAAAVLVPALRLGRLGVAGRRSVLLLAAVVGTYAGFVYLHRYPGYLLWSNGREFGREDPVFGHDIGFYVFDLPWIWTVMHILTVLALVGLASSVLFAWIGRDRGPRPDGVGPVLGFVGHVSRPLTIGFFALLAIAVAGDTWLRRYSLLLADNYEHSIPNGAQVVDVTGLFSTKNAILVETVVLLVAGIFIALRLRTARRAVTGAGPATWRPAFTRGALALLLLPGLSIDIAFRAAVAVREQLEVTPNEPVVQYPFIKRHIDATNTAYGLDKVKVSELRPRSPGDPAPDPERLLASPTFRNLPLWPGYNSWLERLVDPEYVPRLFAPSPTGDLDTTIYGPTLATFQQQEKLRPYYDFMDVDTVRYRVGIEPRLMASSARELPLVEPKPWLAWWGQRFVVFTHGFGLVMAPLGEQDDRGEPVYASRGIPTQASNAALKPANEALYYAEGAGSMAYSNLRSIQEHNRPTDAGREEITYPDNVRAGVRLDSWLKRIVFGWKSRQFVDIVASDLISEKSRVHYYRTPLERLEHIAPFLYNDTDPYAVNRGDGITWMVNGMTTSARYPYSALGELGDKSDRRTPTPRPLRIVNYVRDSVKTTVDAYTGQVSLYKFADEPIVDTWADVYPSLFTAKEEMPAPLRDQVQYPPQLFHLQFDDLYIYYHQKDPLLFFTQEDVFDDGDEVVGPVLDGGRAITFSIEPYYWMTDTGAFAMSMVFTPENALNLRAFATVQMDGADYGKLSVLEVPKGRFFPGPEQADSAIDQDPFISQQVGLWQRQGLEVIRGHTTPLLVEGDVLYVEPLFIRSEQNPLPRLERVIVVYRGKAFMQTTAAQALTAALRPNATFPIRPGPELGGEPAFDERGRLTVPAPADGSG